MYYIHDTKNPEEYEPPSENTDIFGNGTGNQYEGAYGGCGPNTEQYANSIFLSILLLFYFW